MSDFTAIGQLVTEARNLLDSIKGGAIRAMETAFASLIADVNSEWAAKKSQVDNEALAAIGRVDTETVRSEMGFTAQNYNHDFYDINSLSTNRHGVENVFPLGMGVNTGRNDSIKAEMIWVGSGDPELRDPIAKELLDFMGVGRSTTNMSLNFNILKLTILDLDFMALNGYDFTIPDQHVKHYPAASFMAYTKVEGTTTVAVFDAGGTSDWKQHVSHYTGNPHSYSHKDINLENVSVGDVIYLALPTTCVGHWPLSKRHGELYNEKNNTYRKINQLHA
ncbi:phage tail protein [uncultured Vibrio sp.]|uniref:phage tail protein n=1 Tax=uncultured Vibrio sp. TaxID=114054 RepID=UPI0026392C25|nr:phage tail protein [uncultured Vibrio sp.]